MTPGSVRAGRLAAALLVLAPQLPHAQTPVRAMLINGAWFDGTRFVPDTVWVSEGKLRRQRQPHDTVIDLAGGFVVPAAGDAHQHRFSTDRSRREDGPRFVRDGVFYVMIQDLISAAPYPADADTALEHPDVIWTRMPVVDPEGGLVSFFDRLASQGEVPGLPSGAPASGRLYAPIRSRADLERMWDPLLEANPTFVKVLLGFSEDRSRRMTPQFRSDPANAMAKAGFDADLLPALVARAHAARRRVSVHVETAEDFRRAVDAGADMIAHLPGWHVGPTAGFRDQSLDHWLIPEAAAAEAAARRVTVITTTWPKPFFDYVTHGAAFREVQSTNLRRLARAGVPLAIGSDADGTAIDEAQQLRVLGLDNLTILRSLVVTTPRLIFPGRRIGCLDDGCDADLLALRSNPLVDLVSLRTASLIMRQGVVLSAPSAPSFHPVSSVGAVTLLRANRGPVFDNVIVQHGPEGVVLVDAAYSETGDSLDAAVRRLTGRRPSVVINTHFHHAGGNATFADAAIMAHENTATRMRRESRMYGMMPIGPWPEAALPDSIIRGRTTLTLNGEPVDLVHMPNAHTDGDLVVIFRRSGVVATGDVFAPLLNPCDYANGCTWSGYRAAIDRLLDLVPPGAVMFPGHGPAASRAELVEFRELLRQVTESVSASIAQGRSRDQVIAEALPERFARWGTRGVPPDFFLGNAYDAIMAERARR